MRPSTGLMIILLSLSLFYGFLVERVNANRREQQQLFLIQKELVSRLGLSDLVLSTEARYTRHPAVSDPLVVSMDHPGAIDHFPSTLFWAPVH